MSTSNDDKIEAVEIYRQHYAHAGRLNEILYKLPILYATLVGRLWYFAVSILKEDRVIAAAVFVFAAVVCWYSRVTTLRFREVFNFYLDRINAFDREYAVTLLPPEGEKPKVSTIQAYRRMLGVSLALSIVGVIYAILPVSIQQLKSILPISVPS